MNFRLKLAPWLLVWALLAGAQLYALMSLWEASLAGALAVVLLLQAAKLPFTVGRLNDLGRPQDDVILALVPLANVGLWGQLTAGTPREELRQRRIATWAGQISATGAFFQGTKLVLRGLPVFLPLVVLFGLGYGALSQLATDYLAWAQATTNETATQTMQMLLAAAGFLLLYALFQFPKRHRVSRASWIPVLFMLPLALLALPLWLRGSRDLGLAVISAPFEALDLLWGSIVGGLLSIVWMAVGDRLADGKSLSEATSDLGARIGKAWRDVVPVHAGALHAVFIGLQVLIPGIHYAMVYAFTDMAAMFEPDKPAFRRSVQLATGIRPRIFKAQYLAILVYILPGLALQLAVLDPDTFAATLLDPRQHAWWMHALMGGLWLLAVAVVRLSVLMIYRERVALEREREAAGKPATPPENVFAPPAADG